MSLERRPGTLHLLLLSPTDPLVVLVSRGLYWLFDGLLTSLVTLGLVSVILDLDAQQGTLPLIVLAQLVLGSSTYAMAVALSGLSIRWPEARTFVTSTVTIALLSGAGVNGAVPGGALGSVLHVLPVTNGLPAARAAVAGAPVTPSVLLHLGAECVVGLGWLVVAHITVVGSVRRQVRSGHLTAMS
ncbi:hypothetical protein ABZX30_19355 [Streptomyces sp. NPDC004542]|uniref:hypothetical protein n=1 Tax=Streptomyces sp. NPDC004542 TaxID=3154281 RepID=UPI0033A6A432